MQWQAIAGVTNQINEEAKGYLIRKLEKDAAVEAPKVWSEFLSTTTKHLHDSQNYLDVRSNDKTGGLSALMQFDELHEDSGHNNKPLADYVLGKFDERAAAYLGSVKNPLTKKFLQQKLGEYRVHVAQNVTQTEVKLIDGKRYSTAIENIEHSKNTTYDNPQYFESNLSDVITGISSLALPLEAKEKLIHNAREDLAYSAALGSLKNSPESFLQQLRTGINQDSGWENKNWSSHLSFEQRVRLENQATNILRHKQALQENQLKSLLPNHFESILRTGQGIPNLDNLFQATFGKNSDQYRQIKQDESSYQQAFIEMETIKNTDFATAAKRLEELRPKDTINEEGSTNLDTILESQRNYQQQAQIYSIVEKEFQEQLNIAKKDPAKYVEQYWGEELPENTPIVQRLLLRKQIQETKGLPDYLHRYLTNAERETYLQKFNVDDANKLRQVVDEIISIGKEDYQIGLELLDEILKDNKTLAPAVHFYAENRLYGSASKERAELAAIFAQILPKIKDLTTHETKEFAKALEENSTYKQWRGDMLYQQAHNLPEADLMEEGIKTVALYFQQFRNVKNADKALERAARLMIDAAYMSPIEELQIPRQVIAGGKVYDLNERNIKDWLNNYRKDIITGEPVKGSIKYDMEATFGQGAQDIPDKVAAALAQGRWFLNPDRKSLYYAYPLDNGQYQAVMESAEKILTFDLIDLNSPHSILNNRREELSPIENDAFMGY